MRVLLTLLGLTVVTSSSAAVFPGWARDFEDQETSDPVDARDLVGEQVGELELSQTFIQPVALSLSRPLT